MYKQIEFKERRLQLETKKTHVNLDIENIKSDLNFKKHLFFK